MKFKFLRDIIENDQIYLQPHIVAFVEKCQDEIKDKNQLERFLGCLNYICKFYKKLTQDRKIMNQRAQKNS